RVAFAIHVATSPGDLSRCFAVARELRPHLDEASFLARVATQATQGYRVAFAERDGKVLGFAGYRLMDMLHQKESGRTLYVDDLVTARSAQSKGVGQALLGWLAGE